MKHLRFFLMTTIGIAFILGCSGHHGSYHATAMPDPHSFNAHFGDMDSDGDGLVSMAEFNAHFPQAEPKVFHAIDLNQDGTIDHDEWHRFKEAHGMKHHD